MEKFKGIKNYEKMYKVSSVGRVQSLERVVICKHGLRKTKGIFLKEDLSTGYPVVTLAAKRINKRVLVHRLVAQAFLENPKNKPCVNHKNGIKTDNRVENLEWATYSENERHSIDILGKKVLSGEAAYNSKLTEKEVLEIRSINYNISTFTEVAKIYGVSISTIQNIFKRASWKHI